MVLVVGRAVLFRWTPIIHQCRYKMDVAERKPSSGTHVLVFFLSGGARVAISGVTPLFAQ